MLLKENNWWAWQGLNLRPLRCQHSALPLSYTPTWGSLNGPGLRRKPRLRDSERALGTTNYGLQIETRMRLIYAAIMDSSLPPRPTARLRPIEWHHSFSGPPDLCSLGRPVTDGAIVRRWHRIAPDIEQPPLDHHYLTIHLLGAKRITRRSGHDSITADTDCGAISVTPAGNGYSWSTLGPVGFAHLYLSPALIDRVAAEDFDRDPRSIQLIGRVGQSLPLLSALLSGLISELESPSFGSRLVFSSLVNSVIVQLLTECSTAQIVGPRAPYAISPARLRRVSDYIDAHLAADIDLDDLAAIAGLSRYHFSRTFHAATGLPPYRFLIHRRIEAAKVMLLGHQVPIAEIAKTCGFNSRAQFAAMFRRTFGTSPAQFRRDH